MLSDENFFSCIMKIIATTTTTTTTNERIVKHVENQIEISKYAQNTNQQNNNDHQQM